jgi:hypothetical protein
MILDASTLLSGALASNGTRSGQSITATAISANVLDRAGGTTGPAIEDEGSAPRAWLFIQAVTSAAGGDAAKTLTITLESDSTANLATAPIVHLSMGPILGSAITAGAVLACVPLPSADYKRFLGLRYTVSAGFTVFQVAAQITSNPPTSKIPNLSFPFLGGFSLDTP